LGDGARGEAALSGEDGLNPIGGGADGGRVSPTVETLRKYAKAVGERGRVEMA